MVSTKRQVQKPIGGKFTASFFSLCFVFCLFATVGFAAEGSAVTDWENSVITGTGYGAPSDKAKNPGHARILAHQAAMMDGYRRLAEQAKGIHITANSTIEDNISTGDIVVGEVDTVIRRARIVSERYDEYGNCTVVLEIPLFGEKNSIAKVALKPIKKEAFPQPTVNLSVSVNNKTTVNIPKPPVTPVTPTTPTAPTKPAPITPVKPENKPSQSSAADAPKNIDMKASGNYTGLIVDCRGLELQPVMSPVIKNDNGDPIYGYKNLDFDKVVSLGMAGYAKNLEENTERAGKNPLVVKALNLDNNNSYPVISTNDANKALIENQASHFLDNCAVVFIR